MVTIADLVHRLPAAAFDLLCWPLRPLPPLGALAALSALCGMALVWAFGKTSDQAAIHRLRERIRGNLLGVRIFRRDTGAVLRLQRRIFADTARYLRRALPPMVVLLAPVVLVMAQLNLRFAARPVAPGEHVVVKAFVRDPGVLDGPVALDVDGGAAVETPAVRIPAQREVAWRVRALTAGQHRITVRVGGDAVAARLVAGEQWGPVPQRRTGRGVLDTLLYPGEPPIPADRAVEAIEIGYPALELEVLGWPVHWLPAFLVLSLAAGFAVKGRLGVEV